VLLSLDFFFFVKDFLWTMDRDKNGHDGLNGQEWTAEWTMDDGQWTMDNGRWTMDNGQWTMDDGRWTEIMSRLSGLIPTSPIRPIRPIRLISRRKQQTRSQIRVQSHPSKQQHPIKIFVFFRVVRG
jgi:hypothetical protein